MSPQPEPDGPPSLGNTPSAPDAAPADKRAVLADQPAFAAALTAPNQKVAGFVTGTGRDASDRFAVYRNNVAHSLMLGCALAGINVRVATPAGYEPAAAIVDQAKALAGDRCTVTLTDDPKAAAAGAHVLYTDVWASMGQEDLAEKRIHIFEPERKRKRLNSSH